MLSIGGRVRPVCSTTARAGVSQDSPAPLAISPRTWLKIADHHYRHHAVTAPSGRASKSVHFSKLHSAASWVRPAARLWARPGCSPAERRSDNGDVFVPIVCSLGTSPTPQQRSVAGQYRHLARPPPRRPWSIVGRANHRAVTFRENLSIFLKMGLTLASVATIQIKMDRFGREWHARVGMRK